MKCQHRIQLTALICLSVAACGKKSPSPSPPSGAEDTDSTPATVSFAGDIPQATALFSGGPSALDANIRAPLRVQLLAKAITCPEWQAGDSLNEKDYVFELYLAGAEA